jgi:hypothetical protein
VGRLFATLANCHHSRFVGTARSERVQRRFLSHRTKLAVRLVGLMVLLSYGFAVGAGLPFALLAAASVYLEARRPDSVPARYR